MVYQDVVRPSKDVRAYRVNFLLWKRTVGCLHRSIDSIKLEMCKI